MTAQLGKIEPLGWTVTGQAAEIFGIKAQLDRIEKKLDALLEDAGIGDDAKDKGID
jgi:hypothetical protein